MRDLDDLFAALRHSRFRQSKTLVPKDRAYLEDRGLATVLGHAAEFVAQRLAPAQPPNDGRQTPWRGHPVFTAQHATATCCRGCLEQWHRVERGRPLTADEQRYVVEVIGRWLREQLATAPGR